MSNIVTKGFGVSVAAVIFAGFGGGVVITPPTPSAPTITNVSLASGTTLGGDQITITGTDLYPITAVTFGGTSYSLLISNSSTEVTVTTPVHAAGIVTVAASTAVGTATATNAFLFISPAVTPMTAIYSGQTAAGTHQLFLGLTTIPLVQGTSYTDAGVAYPSTLVTNLFDLVPAGNPSQYGVCDHIAVETNDTDQPIVGYLTDEDPNGGLTAFQTAFTAIDPPNRRQGVDLVEKWYPILSDPDNRAARRISIGIQWASEDENVKLYGIAIAYEEKG